ncbi:MAG: serpin family protein [Dehalococcoidales bacterium]|nr:serpin family protein [Dehalococcoidales bacterium]
MKKIFYYILMLTITLSFISCNSPFTGEVLQSDKQRITSPNVNEADLAVLVNGNITFAFDLYQSLKETDDNIFYSPFSISLALAMTYAGARSDTEQQMTDTLSFILSQQHLHPAFNSLETTLNSRGEGAKGKNGEGFRLNIVNAIWGQKDYTFLPEFLDLLAENYGAGLRMLDFTTAPEESRVTINNWISDQTEDRITDLIPQGLINTATRLVLTNAIYFNAAWLYPFSKDITKDAPFYLLNKDKVIVPMMKQTKSFKYITGDTYQAVELPYDGNELSMIILLPDTDQFNSFESSLSLTQVNGIIEKLEQRQVNITMPKFEFKSSFSLKKALSLMGMPVAFSGNADFSGMTGNRDLFIADVIHKTFVSVDEAGTEAAAATAVVMELTAAPDMPVKLTLDHPFIFFIRDIETGTILFTGRITNPSI